MSSFIYNSCLLNSFRAKIDFESDKFKVLLLTDEYEPQKDEHASRADLIGEVAGKGYAAGGVAVNVRVSLADDRLVLTLGGWTLPAATVTARYAVYCLDRGGEPDEDALVACIDFGGDVASTNADFQLTASTLRIVN